MTLEGASRSWRTIYDIVLALDRGRLRPAGIDLGKRGLRSILLDSQAVGEALPHQESLRTSSEPQQVAGRQGGYPQNLAAGGLHSCHGSRTDRWPRWGILLP